MRLLGRVILPAALLLGACSSNPLRPQSPAGDELAELKARVLELQRQVTVHEVEIARLRKQLTEMAAGRRPGGSGAATAPTRPSAGAPAAPAVGPSMQARGEELESEDLEEYELPAASPTPVPPAPGPPATAEVEASPAPTAAGGAPPAPVTPAAQALYDRGYTQYHQGQYVDAESSFQRYLQSYANTDLADNAAYWIGEARYARKDYRAALAAFQEAVERYPEGNKVPDSLLKAGRCLEQLGDIEGAREVYDEVISRFPGSAASVTAEERRELLP